MTAKRKPAAKRAATKRKPPTRRTIYIEKAPVLAQMSGAAGHFGAQEVQRQIQEQMQGLNTIWLQDYAVNFGDDVKLDLPAPITVNDVRLTFRWKQ